MNYKWARDYALELIDQYSVAGTKVPASYNNQADYLHKIPRLLDDGAMLAATTRARIRAAVPLSDLTEAASGTAWTAYTLPADCWQICGGGVVRADGDGIRRFDRYRIIGRDKLILPTGLTGEWAVEYFRYPRALGEDPDEETELDNTPQVQAALPFYAAAHLAMLDNSFAYAALLNEFESRLAAAGEVPRADFGTVTDLYETGDEGCL